MGSRDICKESAERRGDFPPSDVSPVRTYSGSGNRICSECEILASGRSVEENWEVGGMGQATNQPATDFPPPKSFLIAMLDLEDKHRIELSLFALSHIFPPLVSAFLVQFRYLPTCAVAVLVQ